MFCPNCGEKIPDGSKYCEFCGTKLYNAPNAPKAEVREEPDAPHTYVAQPRKKSGLAKGCLIAAVVFVIIAAIVVGLVIHLVLKTAEDMFTSGLSEEEYQSICTEYTYEEIMSDPEAMKGEKVVIEGEIYHGIEEKILGKSFAGYLVDVSEDGEPQLIMVLYSPKSGAAGFSEGDRVAVWGELSDAGTVTMDDGTETVTPTIFAPFIELQD